MPGSNMFYEGCEFYGRVIRIKYPCKWKESPAPGEAVVTIDFDRPVRIYAPMSKVDPANNTVEMDISADCGDHYLVSLPGESENLESVIRVPYSAFSGWPNFTSMSRRHPRDIICGIISA